MFSSPHFCRNDAQPSPAQALQIPKPERLPEINGLLGALLAKCEKDRASLALSKDDALYCEDFALKVFNRADRVDRSGPRSFTFFYLSISL